MGQIVQEVKSDTVSSDTANEQNFQLTDMEIDALGESVNISMGAAAKVLSTILDLKVSITTPNVTITHSSEYEYCSMAPAVGVKIKYIEGLTGINFFVIKQQDVKRIVDIMMGNNDDNTDIQLTELHTSAISEIMNQMMGASSTSLAIFFNTKINISTPECILLEENITAKNALDYYGEIVIVKFKLKIGEIIDSELVNIMPVEFAKKIADNLINVQLPMQSKSIEESEAQGNRGNGFDTGIDTKQQHVRQENRSHGSEQGVKKMAQQENNYSPVSFTNLNTNSNESKPALSNLNIIMDVPLEVIVQIGRTKKQIMEILEFTQGSIIELDKQAGDPVDIIVNGELIARGDVVVIDDNFGVRITQIIHG